MIDCHVHTKRSHHGKGDLEDFVNMAIDKKIKVLGFLEHTPLTFDKEHRLTEKEVILYLKDVNKLKNKYSKHLKILAGLEVDYLPSKEFYTKKMLNGLNYDYALASIHFLENKDERITIWDYEELQNQRWYEQYFNNIKKAASTTFFNGIAHPDLILRSGIPLSKIYDSLIETVITLKKNNLAYEINCSGLSKTSFDPIIKKEVKGKFSYPNFDIIKFANVIKVPLLIGSDAHSPDKLAKNIGSVIDKLKQKGILKLSYFEKGIIHPFRISF